MSRVFYKCPDCLEVLVVEGEHAGRLGLPCAICSAQLTFMGEVVGTAGMGGEEPEPCDARCTSARGPNCSCECGGANHGHDRLVSVIVHGEAFALEAVEDPEALKRAKKYRAALNAAEKRFRQTFRGVDEGSYARKSAQYALRKIKQTKNHERRMDLLSNFLPQ